MLRHQPITLLELAEVQWVSPLGPILDQLDRLLLLLVQHPLIHSLDKLLQAMLRVEGEVWVTWLEGKMN